MKLGIHCVQACWWQCCVCDSLLSCVSWTSDGVITLSSTHQLLLVEVPESLNICCPLHHQWDSKDIHLKVFLSYHRDFLKLVLFPVAQRLFHFPARGGKKGSKCFLWLHKVYFRSKILCLFVFFFLITSSFPCWRIYRECWVMFAPFFAPRKCFFLLIRKF